MSEHATELTREQLDEALFRFHGGTYNDGHLRTVVAAAERLLAMKPASDGEIIEQCGATNVLGYKQVQIGAHAIWRKCERRLLPFADDAAHEINER